VYLGVPYAFHKTSLLLIKKKKKNCFNKSFLKVLIMTFHCSMQKIEKLAAVLHSLDNQPSNRRVYYAEERFELPIFKFLL
jgi:hypothetical protein